MTFASSSAKRRFLPLQVVGESRRGAKIRCAEFGGELDAVPQLEVRQAQGGEGPRPRPG